MDRHTRYLGALLGCAFAFTVAACPRPPKTIDPPTPNPDAGPPPTEGMPCERACKRMQQLGCPEGDPNPKGDACAVWLCQQAKSTTVDHNLECLATLGACTEIDTRCR